MATKEQITKFIRETAEHFTSDFQVMGKEHALEWAELWLKDTLDVDDLTPGEQALVTEIAEQIVVANEYGVEEAAAIQYSDEVDFQNWMATR